MTAIQDAQERRAIEFLGPVLVESLLARPDGRNVLIGYASDVTLRAEFVNGS